MVARNPQSDSDTVGGAPVRPLLDGEKNILYKYNFKQLIEFCGDEIDIGRWGNIN